jgi:spore maturation protein SpmB
MEEWFLEGAADGFTVMPPTMPAQLEIFISTVVPILRERGLYRMEYEYTTMREHYGLPIRGRSRG